MICIWKWDIQIIIYDCIWKWGIGLLTEIVIMRLHRIHYAQKERPRHPKPPSEMSLTVCTLVRKVVLVDAIVTSKMSRGTLQRPGNDPRNFFLCLFLLEPSRRPAMMKRSSTSDSSSSSHHRRALVPNLERKNLVPNLDICHSNKKGKS